MRARHRSRSFQDRSRPVENDGQQCSATREEQLMRFWVIKVLISTLSFIFVVIVLGMVYAFVFRGDSIDSGLIGMFLKTISDIISVFKTP